MMELIKAGTSDALVINSISKRAFDSDIEVGASSKGGPPGYKSVNFHVKMAKANHLYKLSADGLIVGGAILFKDGPKLNIGRIFVDPEYFRKGYGIFMMQEIERIFSDAKELYLDTPVWNIRTNAFYQKLGYSEYKRDDEFIYYVKTTLRKS
ncbi:MAG: GNAT family N-acetyltransferase [Lachnospiraceae bacterium]|nr:GNAT family N-acetyltransferase [Lachnospiraceae bacterium]